MPTTEFVFLSLLFLGIASLLAGIGLTRLYWRTGLPPYGRQTSALDVALRPERYVTGAPLRTIRALNLTGAVLLTGAALITVYEILQAMHLL
jgi:hypothetical protein